MDNEERRFALDGLTASEAQLLDLVRNLSVAQLTFRESPSRWSIAENIQHLILFERFILGAINHALASSPQPKKSSQAAGKLPLVMSLGQPRSRATPLTARELVRPAADPANSDLSDLLAELRRARAETVRLCECTSADLHAHFFPHITFGDLDCYQWLLVIGQHTLRHCLQIQQVGRDTKFPESSLTVL
jgi:hypothetical protein